MGQVSNRFVAAVLAGFEGGPVDPGVMPTALSAAATEVLGVDGAGLSLVDSLRVPLGASGEEVRRAERLQTTLGEGPCLSAVADAEPLVADEAVMAQRWPLFYRELTAQTPFRAVASLPIAWPGQRPFLAMDLYLTDTFPDPELIEDRVRREVSTVVSTLLSGAQMAPLLTDTPPDAAWMNSETVRARMNVWTAVGMVMAHSQVDQPEGLALLRGYAFSHSTSIDDLAEQLTSHRLPVDQLLVDESPPSGGLAGVA